MGVLLAAGVLRESAIGLDQVFGFSWTRSTLRAFHESQEYLFQSEDDLALPIVLDHHLPERLQEEQDLQDGVHVASVALVFDTDVSLIFLHLLLDDNFNRKPVLHKLVQIPVLDHTLPKVIAIQLQPHSLRPWTLLTPLIEQKLGREVVALQDLEGAEVEDKFEASILHIHEHQLSLADHRLLLQSIGFSEADLEKLVEDGPGQYLASDVIFESWFFLFADKIADVDFISADE